MQTKNRFFDDMARVASGAAGALSGMRNEIEGMVRQQMERVLGNMDVVRREEFEAVQTIATTARAEQEALTKRVAALEKQVADLLLDRASHISKTTGLDNAPMGDQS